MSYADNKALASRLIIEKGQPVTFIKKGSTGGFDASGDQVAAEPEPDIEISGNGVKLSYKIAEIDEEVILTGDAKLLYSGEAPKIGMSAVIDGETWGIKHVKPLQPAGLVIMYTLQLRK